VLKKTMGIRVSLEEEIEGLDIGEHGNVAYPDFATVAPVMELGGGTTEHVPEIYSVSPEVAVPVVNRSLPGAKLTKVTIITSSQKFTKLHTTLEGLGITGLTVTNVLGHGMQKGHPQYYRGAPVEKRLLPKVQVDIVICKIPTELLVDSVKKALYTGNVGDGKIFIYDVENVVKVSTGETGYDALQDED
jgi:Nitrogen regulatory protein PII